MQSHWPVALGCPYLLGDWRSAYIPNRCYIKRKFHGQSLRRVGPPRKHLQNIYGNSAVGVAVGRAKNTGSNVPSVWPTQTSRALSLGEMMSGSVSVPSNNTEYGSFVEALNAGVDIFNSATFSQKPEGVVLRRWKSSGTYPVLAD